MRRIAVSAIATAIVTAAPGASSSPPAVDPAHEVQVVAKQFAFDPPIILVAAGERVRLVIRSADAVHGFAIPELKIDVQLPRGGAPVAVEFTAPRAGRYDIACSEFCGSGHGRMKATLISTMATPTVP
jgi:cytochrome c oxidase subunit 2